MKRTAKAHAHCFFLKTSAANRKLTNNQCERNWHFCQFLLGPDRVRMSSRKEPTEASNSWPIPQPLERSKKAFFESRPLGMHELNCAARAQESRSSFLACGICAFRRSRPQSPRHRRQYVHSASRQARVADGELQ